MRTHRTIIINRWQLKDWADVKILSNSLGVSVRVFPKIWKNIKFIGRANKKGFFSLAYECQHTERVSMDSSKIAEQRDFILGLM